MPQTVTQPSLSGLYNTQPHNHHYQDYTTHRHTTITIGIMPNKSHNQHYQDIATHSHTVITIRIIQCTVTNQLYHNQEYTIHNYTMKRIRIIPHNAISIRITPNNTTNVKNMHLHRDSNPGPWNTVLSD